VEAEMGVIIALLFAAAVVAFAVFVYTSVDHTDDVCEACLGFTRTHTCYMARDVIESVMIDDLQVGDEVLLAGNDVTATVVVRSIRQHAKE
jgi:hypothetical protein